MLRYTVLLLSLCYVASARPDCDTAAAEWDDCDLNITSTLVISEKKTFYNVHIQCLTESKTTCIQVGTGATLVMADCLFAGNNKGRCIQLDEGANLNMMSSTVNNFGDAEMKCCIGPGVLAVGKNNVTIHNSKFHHNAADYGGAVVVNDGELLIVDSDLHDNACAGNAGAIHVSNSNAQIMNCRLHDNNVGASGGGLEAVGSTVRLWDTTIQGNVASGSGGGVHVDNSEINVEASLIYSNTGAEKGADLYCHSGKVTLDADSINNIPDKYINSPDCQLIVP